MKKIIYYTCFILLLALTGCNNENEIADTSSPGAAAAAMNFLASLDDVFYDEFKDLFYEQRDEHYIRGKYELIQETKTAGASISTLAIVTYQNNNTLLVQFIHDRETDEYFIYDVIEVPEEVAAFFTTKLE